MSCKNEQLRDLWVVKTSNSEIYEFNIKFAHPPYFVVSVYKSRPFDTFSDWGKDLLSQSTLEYIWRWNKNVYETKIRSTSTRKKDKLWNNKKQKD